MGRMERRKKRNLRSGEKEKMECEEKVERKAEQKKHNGP